MDKLVYQQLRAWSLFRHPNKNRRWVANKYWQTVGGDNWVFAKKFVNIMRDKSLSSCDGSMTISTEYVESDRSHNREIGWGIT